MRKKFKAFLGISVITAILILSLFNIDYEPLKISAAQFYEGAEIIKADKYGTPLNDRGYFKLFLASDVGAVTTPVSYYPNVEEGYFMKGLVPGGIFCLTEYADESYQTALGEIWFIATDSPDPKIREIVYSGLANPPQKDSVFATADGTGIYIIERDYSRLAYEGDFKSVKVLCAVDKLNPESAVPVTLRLEKLAKESGESLEILYRNVVIGEDGLLFKEYMFSEILSGYIYKISAIPPMGYKMPVGAKKLEIDPDIPANVEFYFEKTSNKYLSALSSGSGGFLVEGTVSGQEEITPTQPDVCEITFISDWQDLSEITKYVIKGDTVIVPSSWANPNTQWKTEEGEIITPQTPVTRSGRIDLTYAAGNPPSQTYQINYYYGDEDYGGIRIYQISGRRYGSEISLYPYSDNPPGESGYYFAGWYDDVELTVCVGGAGQPYTVTSGRSLYAKYIKVKQP